MCKNRLFWALLLLSFQGHAPVNPWHRYGIKTSIGLQNEPVHLCILQLDRSTTDQSLETLFAHFLENPLEIPCIPSLPPLGLENLGSVSSGYGMRYHPLGFHPKRHQGIDFAVPKGTPVLATAKGLVLERAHSAALGNHIRLQHPHGFESRYAHLEVSLVQVGDTIKAGEVIGFSGDSGRVTGPHLHYEVRQHGKSLNPARFCNLRLELKQLWNQSL